MEKISVIIPVYNVGQYLRKCLDSVITQTYSNLEILLINDGSTDDSGRICDEYATNDCRIRVFHKLNGGVSSAKNVGLENMTGRYVGFVDSDDWIQSDMYEILYKTLTENHCHISVASYYKVSDTDSVPMTNRTPIPIGIIETKEMLLYPLQRDNYMGFCGYLCNKLFLADVFLKNGLRFDEDINYGEDVLLFTRAVLAGKCRGSYIDKPLYHYYQRTDSIAHSESIKVKADILTAYKKKEELFDKNGYGDISYWARGFYCHHASVIAEIASKNNDVNTLQSMRSKIREHLDDYVRTNADFPEKYERMYCLLDG